MHKNISNGLYKKLAAYSVFFAFTLGLIIGLYQIYRDYSQQESRLISQIDQRVGLVQGSAEKAIYEFDEDLAKIVIDSIGTHQAVLTLSLIDDYDDSFITAKIRNPNPRPNWLADSFTFKTRKLSYPLSVKSEVANQMARIEIEVDSLFMLNDLIDRSITIIISGLIRNILLALILLYLSYRFITRSINGLGSDLALIDPVDVNGDLIVIPNKHKENELGRLATMINELLKKIRQGMQRNGDLNNELNQQLLDKAQIEKALNLAEERTAGRTGKDYIKTMVDFIADTLDLEGVAIYSRIGKSSNIVYDPIVSILNSKSVEQKTLKLKDLPNSIILGDASTESMDLTHVDQNDVFKNLNGLMLPIRNIEGSIINILQLVSNKPFPGHYFQQHKSLLQILSSRFVTENEREQNEEIVLKLAHKDNLTGLSNRNHFQELLKQTMKTAIRKNENVMLFHIDISKFKWINDSYGYLVGDRLLVQIAQRLQGLISESTRVARVGGDEFIITMIDKNINAAKILSKKIHKVIKKTFVINNHLINAKANIGIAMYPDNARNHEELIKHADFAVNKAKRKEGVRTQYFNQEVAKQIERKMLVTNLLNNAIEFSLLELRYQPIFCMKKKKIHSIEVLCRWNNPELGIVSPEEFIPIAEETGLIHNLGSWVLKETIKTIKHLCTELPTYEKIKMSVNFSTHQLSSPILVDQYLTELHQESIDSDLITFEITESMLFEDLEQASEILKTISALGCSISIDDFGTGYSSLQYLKHLPIHNLKIDKSFIKGITMHDSDINIVKAIVSLAEAMNMSVIAEGIETKEQVQILSDLNCNLMQGFYFAKPLNRHDLLKTIKQHSP